ncbi:DoxX family membrane protein [Dermabacteraceae bacterium TAE3-ERU27]|nr:DoxX family membrane protein [Dermabacteraceae bacterium TAE3-ERU27]
MSLIRRVARPLIAAPFVFEGVRCFKDPQRSVAAAPKSFAQVEQWLSDAGIPLNAENLVRVTSAVSVAAGALYATNRMPRVAALGLLATTGVGLAGRRKWSELRGEERTQEIQSLLTDLGLLGAVLLATVDREGYPSLGYRVNKAVERGQKAAARKQRELEKMAKNGQRAVEKKLGA